MAESPDGRRTDLRSIVLVLLSISGAALGYVSSIIVARLLGPDEFEDYAVAIASLALMSTLAEAGTGKYALRIMPSYAAAGDWSAAAGYWRFSLRVVVLVSILIAVAAGAIEIFADERFGNYPLGVAMLFLPAVALSGAGIDFVMANQAAVRGSLIARILVPTTTLFAIMVTASMVDSFHSSWAVSCYGGGALIGALAAGLVFWKTSPPTVFQRTASYHRDLWGRECFAFLSLTMLITLIFRISVVVLEALPVGELEVARFAAAMETGCLILLLSKSTDKYFQPHIAIIIQREAWQEGIELRQRRLLAIGSVCALFMLVIVLYGKSILRLYGEPYVDGYPALCLISLGTCTWTMFSLAPAYLKFVGLDRFVFGTSIAGAISMALLTGLLGNVWGATGAAIAFCVVLCSVAIGYLLFASRDLYDHQRNQTS